jgi:hypothetical protein
MTCGWRWKRDGLDAGYGRDLALPNCFDPWRDSKGIGRTTSGQAANASGNLLEIELRARFAGRILPIDVPVAC